MTTNVTDTLKQFLDNQTNPTSIDIKADKLGSAFGDPIEAAIQQIFAGSISVGGATFKFEPGSPPEASATIKGQGAAPPLLSQVDASASFTASGSDVTMKFDASFTSDYAVSQAWPTVLNEAPFTKLTLSNGSADLTVKPADKSFDLTISATASYDSRPLSTGLFVASYSESKLGFLGGFVVQGTWAPADIPVLDQLSISGDAGLFVSQITEKDLSAFKSLNLVYLPDEITPGLTFFAGMELGGNLSSISSLLPAGSTFDLLAILPPEGITKASVTAELTEPKTQNAFQFNDLKLQWKSTAATAGSISLTVDAAFVDGGNSLEIIGDLTFTYAANPSQDALEGELTAKPTGEWAHPFGIQNFKVVSISFGLSLSEEGINAALDGTVEIGSTSPKVDLTLGAGLLDFEVPSFLEMSLSAASKGSSVTLVNLIDAFIPDLLPQNFPVLSDISFKELSMWAADAEIEVNQKQYYPGFGASGDVSLFGFDIDAEFILKTKTEKAPNQPVVVQAKGSISENGGAIVIKAGSTTILTMSEASDKSKGPFICVDTSGSGFCKTGSAPADSYFVINAAIDLLGLSVSVDAYAAKESFAFDATLGAGNIFSSELACDFEPSGGHFNAAAVMDFHPPDITVPGWGPIPSFTIPTPKIDFGLALGNQAPPSPLPPPLTPPKGTDYFELYFSLEFAGLNPSIQFSIGFSAADLSDPLKFFGEQIGEAILDFLKKSWQDFVKALVWIGHEIKDIAEWVGKQFSVAVDEVFKFAGEVWDAFKEAANEVCAVVTGNDALSSSTASFAMAGADLGIAGLPMVLADLSQTENGHALLHHYYLHRDELNDIVKSGDAPVLNILTPALTAESPEFGLGFECTMAAIESAASAGSEELKESSSEVMSLLQSTEKSSYHQFLQSLGSMQ